MARRSAACRSSTHDYRNFRRLLYREACVPAGGVKVCHLTSFARHSAASLSYPLIRLAR
jgi:hypothetical protein